MQAVSYFIAVLAHAGSKIHTVADPALATQQEVKLQTVGDTCSRRTNLNPCMLAAVTVPFDFAYRTP